MKYLVKWLIFSSVPGLLLALILAVNWKSLIGELESEAAQRTESYYEENRPALLEKMQQGIERLTGSGNPAEKDIHPAHPCDKYQGTVSAISDGDTIIVSDDKNVRHKIRLRGIDAPEKTQEFGDQATRNLAKMIFRQTVRIETCERDRIAPDREISLVLFGNISVNKRQVEAGLAHYYQDYSQNLASGEKSALATSENQAKAQQRGLWINPQPVLPKDFRRLTRTEGVN